MVHDTPLHLLCRANAKQHIKALQGCNLGDISEQNHLGETPLHIVCTIADSDLELVQSLLDCNPSCKLEEHPCNTALHIACRKHAAELIECLVQSQHKASALITNVFEELPIHLLCKNIDKNSLKCLKLFQELHANFNQKTKDGDTLLHLACRNSLNFDILAFLIQEAKCSISIFNNLGDLPLHIACRSKNLSLEMLRMLANNESVNFQNHAGNTAVHEICLNQDSHVVEELLFLKQTGAKFNISDCNNRLPIHLACLKQSLLVVKVFDPSGLALKTENGNTVLHEACNNATPEASHIVQYLLDYKPELDLTAVNTDGDLALHVACRNTTVASTIEQIAKINPSYINLPNKKGDTPLHELMKTKQQSPDLILQLLQLSRTYDLVICNADKVSLLDLACENNLVEVVRYLLTERRSEMHKYINKQDCNGKTPIVLTTSLDVVQILLDNGASAEPLYGLHKDFFQMYGSGSPPQTPVSVLVIGHPLAGKTTLVSSLQEEKDDVTSTIDILNRTAGIVPTDINSKVYGQITTYDFAGQSEYYASHDTFTHNTIKNSPPIVLLVVDLTHQIKDIIGAVNYWSTFIKNRLTSLTDKAHLYVVCSHADVVKSEGKDPKIKCDELSKQIQDTINSITAIEFKQLLAMDCTKSQSEEIKHLRQLFAKSTTQLRRKGVLNFRSHCLSTFLKQTFKDEVAIPLEKLYCKAKMVSKQRPAILDLVPKDPALLNELCRDLSDSGIIIFLQNRKMHQSWLVLNKVALLAVVNGSLFAPSSFPEHVGVYGSNTGVVCFSKLRKIFPQYDPNMMFGFLCHMEFCREILDKEVVERLLAIRKLDEQDKYYFFPNVIKVERPEKKWTHLMKSDTDYYQFGWIMECTNGHFSADFVQLLLLRLMFGSTKIQHLAQAPLDLHTMSTVWKSGILWSNKQGIDTLVDVIEHSRVLVLMKCNRNLKDHVFCLQHRSSLLKAIRLIKQETSCAVQIKEFFVEPQYIHVCYPLKADYHHLLITMDEVLESVSKNFDYVISNGQHRVCIGEILFFDPFVHLCNTLSHSIQSAELSQQQPSQDFVLALANHLHSYFDLFVAVITPSPTLLDEIKQQQSSITKFEKLLQIALKRYGNNFESLKKMFNGMTVFQIELDSPGQFLHACT